MTINNHGDLILYPIKTIKPPKTAEKSKKFILQASEVTGNRHEVVSDKFIYRWTKDGSDKFIYRWTKDGIEYLHSDSDYKIQHIGGDCEHGIQDVEAGTVEVRHEIEYDPWKNELKKVID